MLANDVAQVIYVKDMSTKPRKWKDKEANTSYDEPKRHIVLSGKRDILGVDGKTDMFEDYEKFHEIPPFKVKSDPSILINDEDYPWLRCNKQMTQAKKKWRLSPATIMMIPCQICNRRTCYHCPFCTCTCYVGEIMIPSQLSTFSEFIWNAFMSYGSRLWYFESDCPFCTRSASSFCRNPLYFLEHAMWVKWWYHANFQPFQSSFWNAFQFQSHLAQRMN